MRPICWLHISDIHMHVSDAWSHDVVLKAMCEDPGGPSLRPLNSLVIRKIWSDGNIGVSGQAGCAKQIEQIGLAVLPAMYPNKTPATKRPTA